MTQTSFPFDTAPAAPARPRPIRRDHVGGNERVCLYFAYGSNICLDQMRRRCPNARPLGVAVLPYHGLAFAGFSASWGGAVAHVVPHPTREVPGVIYELSVADLRALDRAEGVPLAYRRTLRRVVDETGAEHVVHVYLHQSTEPGTPTEEYLRQILRGYQRHRIDLDRMLAAMGVAPATAGTAPAPNTQRRRRASAPKKRRRDLRRRDSDA